MKNLLLMLAIVFSVSSFANEVITFNGQKIVMFKVTTAKEVNKIFLSATDDASKIVALKKIFAKEKSYCRIAGQSFADINRTASDYQAKCNELLSEKYFYEMILNDTPSPTSPKELQLLLSQFFTLILLF